MNVGYARLMLVLFHSLCDREEWEWLQSHVYTAQSGGVQNLLSDEEESFAENGALMDFVRCLRSAVTLLLTKLNIPLYRVKRAET